MIGAFYYNWYEGEWASQTARGTASPIQEPTLGFYNSLDPSIVDMHLHWAEQSGIDFLIHQFDESGYRQKRLEKWLKNAPRESFVKISLHYEFLSFFGKDTTIGKSELSKIKRHFSYMCKYLFNQKQWLKIDNKPVVFWYVSRETWCPNCSWSFIGEIRDLVKSYGYDDIYLVGDEVFYMLPEPNRIKQFNSIYFYNMYLGAEEFCGADNSIARQGRDWIEFVDRYVAPYKKVADDYGVRFYPTAIPGYNDLVLNRPKPHYQLNRDGGFFFQENLDWCKTFNPEIILITSFNEWYEDTQIEPVGLDHQHGKISSCKGGICSSYEYDYLLLLKAFKTNYSFPISKKNLSNYCLPPNGTITFTIKLNKPMSKKTFFCALDESNDPLLHLTVEGTDLKIGRYNTKDKIWLHAWSNCLVVGERKHIRLDYGDKVKLEVNSTPKELNFDGCISFKHPYNISVSFGDIKNRECLPEMNSIELQDFTISDSTSRLNSFVEPQPVVMHG